MDKVCGECKYFKHENSEGWGTCVCDNQNMHCSYEHDCFIPKEDEVVSVKNRRMDNIEMEGMSCPNCVFEDEPSGIEPCNSCDNGNGYNGINNYTERCCANCTHQQATEPCNECSDDLDKFSLKVEAKEVEKPLNDDIKPNLVPIGVTPAFTVYEPRLKEIAEAIERYIEAEKDIPFEWIRESNLLLKYFIKQEELR